MSNFLGRHCACATLCPAQLSLHWKYYFPSVLTLGEQADRMRCVLYTSTSCTLQGFLNGSADFAILGGHSRPWVKAPRRIWQHELCGPRPALELHAPGLLRIRDKFPHSLRHCYLLSCIYLGSITQSSFSLGVYCFSILSANMNLQWLIWRDLDSRSVLRKASIVPCTWPIFIRMLNVMKLAIFQSIEHCS